MWYNYRASGKDSVANVWVKGTIGGTTDLNLKTTPLASGGNGTMAYTSGYFSYNLVPTATRKQGDFQTGSYLVLGRKEKDNSWKISYVHLTESPVQQKK